MSGHNNHRGGKPVSPLLERVEHRPEVVSSALDGASVVAVESVEEDVVGVGDDAQDKPVAIDIH